MNVLDKIAEIEARLKRLPGEKWVLRREDRAICTDKDSWIPVAVFGGSSRQIQAVSDFVLHSPEDIHFLLSVIKGMR